MKSRKETWKAIVEEKIDVKIDEHGKEWVDMKDFQYLYLEYHSFLITNVFLLFTILVLAIMYMLSGIK